MARAYDGRVSDRNYSAVAYVYDVKYASFDYYYTTNIQRTSTGGAHEIIIIIITTSYRNNRSCNSVVIISDDRSNNRNEFIIILPSKWLREYRKRYRVRLTIARISFGWRRIIRTNTRTRGARPRARKLKIGTNPINGARETWIRQIENGAKIWEYPQDLFSDDDPGRPSQLDTPGPRSY